MDQTVNRKSNNKVIVLNKIKTYFSKPQNIILLLFGIVLTFTTVAPIVAIVKDTLMIHPGTIDAHLTGKASGYTIVNYVDLFTSRLARTNLWKPLWNTLLLAVLTCLISSLYGGGFAFRVTRTNLKFKKDFLAGYSPDRNNPGEKLHTVEKIKKVTKGSNPEI